MAQDDIRPVVDAHGGHKLMRHFRMGALTTDATEDTSWERGEILLLDAAVGDINPAGTGAGGAEDPSGGLHYIAAAGSSELIAHNNGTSGAATHDISVPVYDVNNGGEFKTQNVYSNSDTNLGPGGNGAMTGVLIGVTCDFWVDDSATAHIHGIDINGDYFTITRIVDSEGRDTWLTGNDPAWVYFAKTT